MARAGVYVRDVHSLETLTSTIERTGEEMANIDQNVNSYLNEVMGTLERQLNFIQGRLSEAEMRLNVAEVALAACHASQVTNELGMVVPSCDCEERDVADARAEVEKWRGRYERGQQIVSECQREIGDYNGHGGGHSLIRNMSEQQTPKAAEILREHIDRLQDILSSNMVANTSNTVVCGLPGELSTPEGARTSDKKKNS